MGFFGGVDGGAVDDVEGVGLDVFDDLSRSAPVGMSYRRMQWEDVRNDLHP